MSGGGSARNGRIPWWPQLLAAASVVAVAATITVSQVMGSAGDRHLVVGCSLVGCIPGWVVNALAIQRTIPEARHVYVCIDGVECEMERVNPGGRSVGIGANTVLPDDRPVRVELSLFDEHFELVRNTTFVGMARHVYPNGRACDAGCVNLELYYDPEDNVLSDRLRTIRRYFHPAEHRRG